MSTTSTISSSTMNAAPRSRSTFRVAAIGALAATVVNVALWLGGRAADVSFLVSPLAGPSTMQVGVVEVALTTLLTLAVGWAALAWAARRSRRWVHGVMVTAAAVAVVSAAGPVSPAGDTATAALLAAMHLVSAAAFLVVVKAR